MTKAKMILDIQVAEARAWKHYRDMDAAAGRDSSISEAQITRCRTQWGTLYDLREAMGIPALGARALDAMGLLPEVMSRVA